MILIANFMNDWIRFRFLVMICWNVFGYSLTASQCYDLGINEKLTVCIWMNMQRLLLTEHCSDTVIILSSNILTEIVFVEHPQHGHRQTLACLVLDYGRPPHRLHPKDDSWMPSTRPSRDRQSFPARHSFDGIGGRECRHSLPVLQVCRPGWCIDHRSLEELEETLGRQELMWGMVPLR